MKSPSEQKEEGRKLLDTQIRHINSIIYNLEFLKKNPEFTRSGMTTLNTIQSDLLVLIQSYGECIMNLMRQGYEID